MEGYTSETPPNVRVTVQEDANNSLQELFNPSHRNLQVPLIQRKLPKSFFEPPTGQCHVYKPNEQNHGYSLTTEFEISHSKANSSPACLDASFCAQMDSNVPTHNHQKSLDIGVKYDPSYFHDAGYLADVPSLR